MHVTVSVCTRNRGAGIVVTLRSLAALDYDDFDVVIIDQSTNDDTAKAIGEAVAGDARFTCIRSQSVGASAARNIAVKQARGPIIAFTDDDCEVKPDWLSRLVDVFYRYPDAGVVYGQVLAAPHDMARGYIPTYEVRHFKRITSPWFKWREGGIGANRAYRQEALQAAGPFDEMLGPGSPLRSCEDGDMTYRVLRAGYSVINIPDAQVIHSGFHSFEQGKMVARHTYQGISAAYMKHLRLGDMAILPTILYLWMFRCVSWKDLLLLRKRSGLGRFLYYGLGLVVSFRYQVDRRWRIYRPR